MYILVYCLLPITRLPAFNHPAARQRRQPGRGQSSQPKAARQRGPAPQCTAASQGRGGAPKDYTKPQHNIYVYIYIYMFKDINIYLLVMLDVFNIRYLIFYVKLLLFATLV